MILYKLFTVQTQEADMNREDQSVQQIHFMDVSSSLKM